MPNGHSTCSRTYIQSRIRTVCTGYGGLRLCNTFYYHTRLLAVRTQIFQLLAWGGVPSKRAVRYDYRPNSSSVGPAEE